MVLLLGVHMASDVAPKDCSLKSFTYWSAEMAQGSDESGWIFIRCLRAGIKRNLDLTAAERAELYTEIIPYLDRMLAKVHGADLLTHQWRNNGVYLRTPRTDRSSADLRAEYLRLLKLAA